MRLDFNVLWVEDQPKRVALQLERIKNQIRKEGFRLQEVFALSVDDAKGYLSSDIYGDHIDLILMDYDLGAGAKGSEGLIEVRGTFPYKDIIFYSSQAADLLKLIPPQVQGIFCSTRDDLPNTVEGIFESLVKKVLDIDHSRGIVMGATSDIDHYVNDCLSLSFDKSDAEKQKAALSKIAARIEEKRTLFEKEAAEILAVAHVSGLLDFHQVYTSVDRLNLFRKVIEALQIHPECVPEIKRYVAETIPKRNALAHLQVKSDGFSRKLYNRKGEEMTADQMKTLRQELLNFQELFETLYARMSAS